MVHGRVKVRELKARRSIDETVSDEKRDIGMSDDKIQISDQRLCEHQTLSGRTQCSQANASCVTFLLDHSNCARASRIRGCDILAARGWLTL